MKKKFLLPFLFITVIACSTSEKKENEQLQSQITELKQKIISLQDKISRYEGDRELIRKYLYKFEEPGYWTIEDDFQTKERRPVLKKAFEKTENLPLLIEEEINKNYPPPESPGLKFKKIEDNIAYIQILNGEMLTQRMGSSGAEGYIAMITFSFTSIENVSHVYLFGFPEGDHAAPGCYSRFDFLQYIGLIQEINEKDT